ncbi:hypothetical protein AB9F41_37795, partial [Rhizobium leguminosarum]|uniref:hypothetical protein n=1 Tax=Rhizobium leguminosarum TaxID=384 RepID=UPI003F968EE6
GFGLMLANKLHSHGFTVIGTSREPEKYAGKVPFKRCLRKCGRIAFVTFTVHQKLVSNCFRAKSSGVYSARPVSM